ncbi:unnamed protein product [Urochloa humidicola]
MAKHRGRKGRSRGAHRLQQGDGDEGELARDRGEVAAPPPPPAAELMAGGRRRQNQAWLHKGQSKPPSPLPEPEELQEMMHFASHEDGGPMQPCPEGGCRVRVGPGHRELQLHVHFCHIRPEGWWDEDN